MPYADPERRREAVRASKRKYEEKREKRYTTWMCIFYEDSAPADWRNMLSELQVRMWVSPSHDKDVWRESDEAKDPSHKAGSYKKAHRHAIVQFDHSRTMEDAWRVLGTLRGPKNIKRVEDLSASVRYLIHKDDPDKAQYAPEDVLTFGGADPEALESFGKAERYMELGRMRRFIRDHDICDFYAFYDYCDQCESRWAHLLDDSCTYVIERYIGSRRAAKKDGTYKDPLVGDPESDDFPPEVANIECDPCTGEVIGNIYGEG